MLAVAFSPPAGSHPSSTWQVLWCLPVLDLVGPPCTAAEAPTAHSTTWTARSCTYLRSCSLVVVQWRRCSCLTASCLQACRPAALPPPWLRQPWHSSSSSRGARWVGGAVAAAAGDETRRKCGAQFTSGEGRGGGGLGPEWRRPSFVLSVARACTHHSHFLLLHPPLSLPPQHAPLTTCSDISDAVSEAQLASFFADCGQLVDCRVCGDPNSSMRFAFIEFVGEEGAHQVRRRHRGGSRGAGC